MSSGCKGIITENECLLALNEFKNGKSPGSDGFTAELHKFVWNDLSENLILSLNYAFEKGKLSICQKRGLISLLPKKEQTCKQFKQPTSNLIVKH